MHRRAFFTATVAGITTVAAGCLSGEERVNESSGGGANDDYKADISYQRCTKPFVPLWEIPPGIRDEVETALEDGEYAADELAYPVLVSDDTTLWDTDDNRYYTHRVNTDDSTPKLIFEEVTPAAEDSGEIKISNQTADTVEINATISTDSDVLVDTEVSVDPADDITEVEDVSSREFAGEREAAEALPGVEFPRSFREYEVEVVVETVEDEHVETATIETHPWFQYYWVQISDGGLTTGSLWVNDYGLFIEGASHSKEGVHWECTDPPSGWRKEQD